MSRNNVDFGQLLEGIDARSLRVRLTGEVDEEMFAKLHAALSGFNALAKGRKKPRIRVILNSHGGSVYQGFAIYDIIRANPVPVDVLAIGECSSAASLILQAGARRMITKHATICIHFGPHASDSAAEADHDKRLDSFWVDLMAERVNVGPQTVAKWHRGETYFTAERALSVGLVDEVVP